MTNYFPWKQIKEKWEQLLFPRVCPVCGEILTERNNRSGNPWICDFCEGKLSYPTGSRCMICSKPLEEETGELCRDCSRHRRYFDGGKALLIHDEPARKMLYGLKYSGRRDNADFLASDAAKKLGSSILRWNPEVLIPVPLHKKRQLSRGFNQTEVLARRLSEEMERMYGAHISVCTDFLIRDRRTRPQKELGREERAANVRDVFRANPSRTVPERVLLLDDIYTSGATLNECARVLKASGVRRVWFVTMSIGG